MDERAALLTLAVRAVETADRERRTWTDEDRAWASRAAAEVVGEGASPAHFVAQRARLAWQRLASREAAFVRAVERLHWRPAIGGGLLLVALAAGLALERIGSEQRINLLALPVLGLLTWNLVVYFWLFASLLLRLSKRPRRLPAASPRVGAEKVALDSAPAPDDARQAAPLPASALVRRLLVLVAAGTAWRWPPRAGALVDSALSPLLADWSRAAAPLYAARAARLLHCAAALFALGIIAGFYLRGIAFEYRAGWESTFLSPPAVHALLAWLFAPGLWLTGQTLPELAPLRFTPGSAGVNAAPWLHLLAATLLSVVVLPRLLLAALSHFSERQQVGRLVADFSAPYFQALLRGYQSAPPCLSVIPYSYHPSAAALEGLHKVAARVFAGSPLLACLAPVGYGDEDALPAASRPAGGTPACALFNLAATPEREAQGAFLGALRACLAGAPLLAVVDEAPWRARFGVADRRLVERRAAWQAGLAEFGLTPVFVDLAQPDLAAVQAAIDALPEALR